MNGSITETSRACPDLIARVPFICRAAGLARVDQVVDDIRVAARHLFDVLQEQVGADLLNQVNAAGLAQPVTFGVFFMR